MVMKHRILCVILTTMLLLLYDVIYAQKESYQEGEIYIRFKSTASVSKQPNHAKENILPYVRLLKDLKEAFGMKNLRNSFHFSRLDKFKRTYRLQFDKKEKLEELLLLLRTHPEIEFAEPVPLMRPTWVPNDLDTTSSTDQYALQLMHAEKAWDITRGRKSVVVAVVDDGVNLDHPDLINKLVAGYDVADGDNNPDIPHTGFDHGTHVAGIVGAETNNDIGVASIGNLVMIMPVKVVYDDAEDPGSEFTHGYEGIIWAAENGADIINCSWGGYGSTIFNEEIITTATEMGALIVAAAGNDNTTLKMYPAAYPYVLSVASSNADDKKSDFSNHGSWIDVSAPGSSILSTIPDLPIDSYAFFNGTSMAAPMVSAVAALIKSLFSFYSPAAITEIIKKTADPIIYANDPSYNGLLGTGRVDAYFAVREAYICSITQTLSGNAFRVAFTECSDWIKTSGTCTVPTNEQVIFDAGNYIELKPGFRAVTGSVFKAQINGCGD